LQLIYTYCSEAAVAATTLYIAVQQLPRFRSPCWRREVFKIDDQYICAAAEHGLLYVTVATGSEEPGTSEVGSGHWFTMVPSQSRITMHQLGLLGHGLS
jgi:hypothetical protein